tara:strand:+ start:33480 stop:33935 length:456 start_codon:yes stop_codon:yes gene_type:complete
MLYFAYGANLNINGMKRRCPKAKPMGKFSLPSHKLVFKGVADIEEQDGSEVHGVLWDITEDCEKALDRFEGYPYLYLKRTSWRKINGYAEPVMFYVMRNSKEYIMPSTPYLECIKEGYEDFDLNIECLKNALDFTKKNDRGFKHISYNWGS